MPFNYNIHPSNELFKPSGDMWFSRDVRKINSNRQSSSKSAVMESSTRPQPNPCRRDQDKLKSKSNFDPCHEAKLDTLGEIFRRESVKGSSTQRDELVRHMSNLPSFLKGSSDRGKNIQGKALNVGVLDWSRLEKWKNKRSEQSSSSSSSRPATTSSTTTARGHKKHGDRKGLRYSCVQGSYKEGLPESSTLHSQNVKRYQYSETEIRTLGDELRMTASEFQSHLDTSPQKEKSSQIRNFASESRHHGVAVVPNENSNGYDVEVKSNMEGLKQHSLKKKERNLQSISHKKGSSFSSQKNMCSRSSEAKKKMDQILETDIDVGYKQYHSIPSNIVLLRPRKFMESSSEDYFQLSQSRTSSDEIFSESSQSSSSYISLPEEVYTEDVYSEASHSGVLDSMTNLASFITTQHSVNTDTDFDHSTIVFKRPGFSNMRPSLPSEDTCVEKDMPDNKITNQCAFTNMKEFQYHETAEDATPSAWNPSSQPHNGFGLSRIGRSFSFKEGSTLPKLSSMNVSAKSGPLTFESSGYLGNSKIYKATGHNRTRSSSSFRRLIEPMLKLKPSNFHHSAECSPTRSINFPAERGKESSIQAFLQLTIKNGLPLFKFVINSEKKVLAATIKSLEKDAVGCYFTFYLVNETKNKGGKWMSHWNKIKNCGYEYNIVGQMKISSSRITESSDQIKCVEKDYVLFGADDDQRDQGLQDFTNSKELAAVVMETPCENASHEGSLSNNLPKMGCLKCLEDEMCFCSSQEIDIPGRIRVILPGGVHSSPIKGEPSPLIRRWKMGGICDCGGWDVGCKLLVLSNKYLSSNVPRSLQSYLERFQLFVQEGAEQNTPLFALAPLKDGFYSVEFSSKINHLQAFFISIAVLNSQKLRSPLEIGYKPEEINGELQMKPPLHYNPIPPLSPVDRV